jgi:hypothetical protein
MDLKSSALDYLKKITGNKPTQQNDNNFKRDKNMYKQDLTPEEQKKMNALLNLDFEDYKKQVKKDRIEQDRVDYSKIKFADNYCKPTQNNTFLIIGIVLIIFAIALILLTKSS